VSQTEKFDETHSLSLGGGNRAIKPGDIVGGAYILKSLLGHGGMGYVFVAEHNIIKKDYALKIIRPDKLDEFSWKRFEIEGRVIAKLDHPNLVKIYNMGLDQGIYPFYVMDLLPGQALSDYIKQDAGLTFEQCLDIFRQVAQGLAYSHKKGIVHRDIKPANIILIKEENDKGGFQAKVVDFGLAKVINPVAGQAITTKGQIFGSPYYMSPEQCQGQAIDHRSDIYSLGCALFESIAGEPPFVGANAMQTLMMHTESAMPKLADRFSEQPAIAVDSLIAKMTAKEPQDRYQSMDEVAAAIERLQKRGTSLSLSSNSGLRDQTTTITTGKKGESDSSIVQSSFLSRADSKWFLVGSLFVVLSIVVAFVYADRAVLFSGIKTSSPSTELIAFGPIKSHLAADTGLRVFQFPETSIGSIIDLSTSEDHNARGTVSVSKDHTYTLSLNENLVPITFKCPQVLEQIGKDEFIGLELKAKLGMFISARSETNDQKLDLNGPTRSERVANSQKQLLSILKIVSGWSKLKVLTLEDFTLNKEIFESIDRLPNLKMLIVKSSEFSMSDFSEYKFLSRLSFLRMQESGERQIDSLLYKLAASANLNVLELDNVDFTAPALEQLRHCPHLLQLAFKQVLVSDDDIQAISQLRGLRSVSFDRVKLTDSQLAALVKHKKLEVVLQASDYFGHNLEQEQALWKTYRQKFPTVVFR
jgi:serine/threonine protein kinase